MPSLDEALRLKRSGDLDAAVIALEGVLGRAPGDPVVLTHLAEVQLKRGRSEEAAGALERAEAAAGTTRSTARVRGNLCYRQRRWNEAARHYQDAAALGDESSWLLVQLARCRLNAGDLDGARAAAAQAAERDQAAPGPWVVLGDIDLREKRPDDAEARYARAHDLAPGDQWAYAKLVESRLLRLPPERREREVQVILKTTGQGNRHLVGVLARLRGDLGDQEDAARTWGQRARAGDLYARKQEGFALRKAGKLDEAASVLRACLEADPEDLYVFRSYVSLQRKREAWEELRVTLEEALPRAGSRRGAFYGELRKLPPEAAPR